MEAKVGRRYAEALFEVAQEQEYVKDVEANLLAVKQTLDTDESFRSFLYSPHVSKEDKLAIANKLFSEKMVAPAYHIIRLMIEKRRETEIESMIDEFIKLRRESAGVLFATITSATPLDSDQQKALVDSLKKKSGKNVEAHFEVEPRLVGGVKVAYGTVVLDGSVQGRLRQIGDMLRRDVLKQA